MAAVTSNYAYDSIYELTQVTQAANPTETYTYDPVGNRLSSLAATASSYNASNQLTSNSNATYTYDANGNTISKTDSTGTTTYTWDFENRLASVVLPGTGGTVSFKYDPTGGRRIQKQFTQGMTVVISNYIYDRSNLVETTDQNGNVDSRYAQGRSIDEPLAESTAGTVNYYEADALGSVTSLSSATGAPTQTYTYDSFGTMTASVGSSTNTFKYAGREYDSETGLYYNRARSLNPSTGRFLSEDPVRYLGGHNFYKYAENNPVDLVDPRGLYSVCAWVGSEEVASWDTATRRYTTPWTYAFATTDGGPDQQSLIIVANLHCHWKANYVHQVWETTVYMNKFLCVEFMSCGIKLPYPKVTFDTRRRYLGEQPGGTETITMSQNVKGYDSEFLDWIYCRGNPPPNH
jgi:RHS repeat-associated protein